MGPCGNGPKRTAAGSQVWFMPTSSQLEHTLRRSSGLPGPVRTLLPRGDAQGSVPRGAAPATARAPCYRGRSHARHPLEDTCLRLRMSLAETASRIDEHSGEHGVREAPGVGVLPRRMIGLQHARHAQSAAVHDVTMCERRGWQLHAAARHQATPGVVGDASEDHHESDPGECRELASRDGRGRWRLLRASACCRAAHSARRRPRRRRSARDRRTDDVMWPCWRSRRPSSPASGNRPTR